MPWQPEHRRAKKSRGRTLTAHKRGYTHKWSDYSKNAILQPGWEFCYICGGQVQCIDHVVPPSSVGKPGSGPYNRLFWDELNHAPCCITCNSEKGESLDEKYRGLFNAWRGDLPEQDMTFC